MTYRQGIRRNWPQFALQLLIVFAVGLTIGTERNVVPVLGDLVMDCMYRQNSRYVCISYPC